MKLTESGKAFYAYGINGVEVNKNNPDIIDISYGKKHLPISIHKEKLESFIKAIAPETNNKEYYPDAFEKYKDILVEFADYKLSGRAIVIVTDFRDSLEYENGGQNSIIGYTGIDLSGKYVANNLEDLFVDDVTYEELYPKKNGLE